jgi:hypothetical protein
MRNFYIIISLMILLPACKKERLSGDASILGFSVADLSRTNLTLDSVFIDKSTRNISLLFKNNLPPDSFPLSFITNFSLTAGATSIPASGETVTLNNIDECGEYTLTAENGSKINYYVVVRGDQIPNSGFEDWYTTTGMNGAPYSEPGLLAETTVWATANNGTSIFGVYCTQPVLNATNTVAQIATGETSLVPLTAGTLFTGKFDTDAAISNPTDTRKAVIFGIPFTMRPKAIKFRYTYQPGSRYVEATLKNPNSIFGGFTVADIEGEDMFTAFVILEVRDKTGTTEIGRADFSSGDLQEEFTELELPISYSGSQRPTHISVVFSSSKYGDLFTGAVGSTLTVDDLELQYE